MALSDSVIESLKEVDACLRNALAYAARQEGAIRGIKHLQDVSRYRFSYLY